MTTFAFSYQVVMIQPFSIGVILGLLDQVRLFLDAKCFGWNILDALKV